MCDVSGLHEAPEAAGELSPGGPLAGGRDVLPDPRDPGPPRALPGPGDELRQRLARQADRGTPPRRVGECVCARLRHLRWQIRRSSPNCCQS